MKHAKKCATKKKQPCDCDGAHTFKELYEHRIALWVALCWQFASKYKDVNPVWRTQTHSDGSEYVGYFVLGLWTENDQQITYHLPFGYWKDCNFAVTLKKAPVFDGHSSDDVIQRLNRLA